MIIEAKSSQQQNTPVDPRKKFEFNAPEKLTRLPAYLALIFTGLAAFIKSAFPAGAEDNDAGFPGLSSAASSAPRGQRSEPGGPGVDPMTTGGIEEEQSKGTIGHAAQPWDTGFVMPDPIAFHYTAVSFDFLGPHVAPFFPAAVNYRPHNDNAATPGMAVPDPAPAAGTGRPLQTSQPPAAINTDPPDDTDPPPDGGEDDDADDDEDTNTPPPANRAPMVLGPVRLNDVFAGQVVLIGLSQLLLGATDPDNDVLTINDLIATGGTLVRIGSGWSFATSHGMLGTVTFTYAVSDGLLSTVQTASIEIIRNQQRLTPQDDVHAGTPWDDDIDALAGDDIIDARAGNDSVLGGFGNDHINGGTGDDQLFGGAGDDIIFGGSGNDLIGGGDGNDQLHGEAGDDVIEGDGGDDLLTGGDGNDIVEGGEGNDIITGDAGNDVIIAGTGDDTADGGQGDDVINGNEGDDVLTGAEGNDTIDAGAGDDIATGNDGDDTLFGRQGDDQLMGGSGDDAVNGDEGDDTLWGGTGNDTLFGGEGDDEIYGEDGADLIAGGMGDDEVDGGAGNDRIMGDAGHDRIDGGDGHDILDYSNFTADIHLDLAAGIALSDEIDEDLFENIEEIIGGRGDDTFIFGDVAAVVAGGGGDDLFIFTVSQPQPELSHQLVFGILDFVVGDRIHVAEYEISQRAERLEEERFGDVYDAIDDGFEDGLPIRVSYAYYDDMDHTIIEADVDRNDFYEISITLDGVQLPLAIGNHVA